MDVLSSPCRSCGCTALAPVLSIGHTPLANRLLTNAQLGAPEPTFPLDLCFCPDCTLVQITETVSPEELFREYVYFSSFADTAVRNAQELVERLLRSRHLDRHSLVAEIASNDGYLLQHYVRAGVPVLGIEPAKNIARVAEERGVRTLCEFFGEAVAEQLLAAGERADVIHANNVLAHVADLNGFVAGIALLLKDDGTAVIEVPYLRDLIDHVEFDTIYHEHLCYFSLTALDGLFHRHGLRVADVERIPIHGGSLRLFICLGDGTRSAAIEKLLTEECAWGVDSAEHYRGFGARVRQLRDDLLALLRVLRGQGKRIAVYGASAKGSTLLNYFGIGRETVEFVVDRSTVKQGLYTPGTHLPIRPVEALLDERPDYVLLLAWNFADEILGQQEEYRRLGGRFIIPIPELRVV